MGALKVSLVVFALAMAIVIIALSVMTAGATTNKVTQITYPPKQAPETVIVPREEPVVEEETVAVEVPKTIERTCTIVTCYYRLNQSKHPATKYDQWMKNMLTCIETPMVIFCEEEWRDKIMALRNGKEDRTRIYSLAIDEMKCAQYRAHWEKDWTRDHEHNIHNPDLFQLWSEKSAFVERALQEDPFHTDFYCWCDIGCFRDEAVMGDYAHWPHPDFLRQAEHDRMYLLEFEPFSTAEWNMVNDQEPFRYVDRIGGTMFLGYREIWPRWIRAYYDMIEQYVARDHFIGKDQCVMAHVVISQPDLCFLVPPSKQCRNRWFYLHEYFSHA